MCQPARQCLTWHQGDPHARSRFDLALDLDSWQGRKTAKGAARSGYPRDDTTSHHSQDGIRADNEESAGQKTGRCSLHHGPPQPRIDAQWQKPHCGASAWQSPVTTTRGMTLCQTRTTTISTMVAPPAATTPTSPVARGGPEEEVDPAPHWKTSAESHRSIDSWICP